MSKAEQFDNHLAVNYVFVTFTRNLVLWVSGLHNLQFKLLKRFYLMRQMIYNFHPELTFPVSGIAMLWKVSGTDCSLLQRPHHRFPSVLTAVPGLMPAVTMNTPYLWQNLGLWKQ